MSESKFGNELSSGLRIKGKRMRESEDDVIFGCFQRDIQADTGI